MKGAQHLGDLLMRGEKPHEKTGERPYPMGNVSGRVEKKATPEGRSFCGRGEGA